MSIKQASSKSVVNIRNLDTAIISYAQAYEILVHKHRPRKTSLEPKSLESFLQSRNLSTVELLSYGPNSIVYLGRERNGNRTLVVKFLLKANIEQLGGNVLKRTIDSEKIYASGSVAQLYEFCFLGKSTVALVYDYYPKGSLAKLLIDNNGPVEESLVQTIFKLLLKSVIHLHSCKVAHRNLKLENVLLDQDMSPVLTDWSYSLIVEDSTNSSSVFATSLPYLAPEVFSQIPYDPIIADIWSLGVCLYTMLNNCLPFEYDKHLNQANNWQIKLRPEVESVVSEEAIKCIQLMLQTDVNKRPSAVTLQQESWFRK